MATLLTHRIVEGNCPRGLPSPDVRGSGAVSFMDHWRVAVGNPPFLVMVRANGRLLSSRPEIVAGYIGCTKVAVTR